MCLGLGRYCLSSKSTFKSNKYKSESKIKSKVKSTSKMREGMAMNSANPMAVPVLPVLPGLYIVTVDCDELISVNAHNPHIAAKCISVNRHHCKFGRAKNLRARYRNYLKTFAPHWVAFRVVALLDDINAAETACGKE